MVQNAGAGIEATGLRAFPAGADRDKILAPAEGHVTAKGELVGTYGQTVEPPK